MRSAPIEQEISDRIAAALWDGAMTREVYIGTEALGRVGDCLRRHFGDRCAMVVADTNTYAAAGQSVHEMLVTSGHDMADPFVFDDPALCAEYGYVARLRAALAARDVVPIAVGAGTINDVTKLAAGESGRPYLAVATAASMDGYTSFGASITRDGYKQTLPCPAPLAVVVDLDVLVDAPPRLNAAGYADLLAKIPAGADWLVADALGVEPLDARAWSLVQQRLREWLDDPAAVRRGDRAALARLVEGLIMTGLGMQRTGTTRPASGAEHQFSHLWDIEQHTFHGAAPMHGEKVGIGTVVSAAIYERVLRMKPESVPTGLESIRARWPPWDEVEAATRRDFPDPRLADQVVEQQRGKYLAADGLLPRLRRLTSSWNELRARLHEQLQPAAKIEQMLAEAGALNEPEAIGISRQRLRDSCRLAQKIRNRYTVLDLVHETGWWDDCVESLFRAGGIWP